VGAENIGRLRRDPVTSRYSASRWGIEHRNAAGDASSGGGCSPRDRQSGAAHHVISTATARRVGQARRPRSRGRRYPRRLRRCSSLRLLAAQTELEADLGARPDPERWGGEVFQHDALAAVIDGDIIPARPIRPYRCRSRPSIDLLVARTPRDRLFLVPGDVIDHITVGATSAYGLPVRHGRSPPIARRIQAPAPATCSAAIQADWSWHIPAIRLARRPTRRAPRPPTCTRLPGARRSLADVLARAMRSRSRSFRHARQRKPNCSGERTRHSSWQTTMHAAWVAFATHGDPGWPKYDLSRRQPMRFDNLAGRRRSSIRERALWGRRALVSLPPGQSQGHCAPHRAVRLDRWRLYPYQGAGKVRR